MSTKERPTPETEVETLFRNVQTAGGVEQWELVRAAFARSLEKQRDELREALAEYMSAESEHTDAMLLAFDESLSTATKNAAQTKANVRLAKAKTAALSLLRNNDKKEDKS
jgi:predicted RNA-binding protein with PIN domain